ncbi:MAG: SAM-dependent methyltransferase [Cytophagales bacterium]|nr:SAM-dependent methyltransferase [Cytophagales bacterium]
MSGLLFLIPCYLSEANDASFITPIVKDVLSNTSFFLAENVRTARRFISSLKLDVDISSLHFEVMDKSTDMYTIEYLMKPILEGQDLGIISEAGLPGLADPGNVAVSWAHKNNIRVVPLPGASSIQMALIGSGFNGQQFTFHGYLPIDKKERAQDILRLEKEVNRTGYTQIFMETPFRNDQMVSAILAICNPQTYLSVAADISGENEFIATMTIEEWKKSIPSLHKIPTIFCLGNLYGLINLF